MGPATVDADYTDRNSSFSGFAADSTRPGTVPGPGERP